MSGGGDAHDKGCHVEGTPSQRVANGAPHIETARKETGVIETNRRSAMSHAALVMVCARLTVWHPADTGFREYNIRTRDEPHLSRAGIIVSCSRV